MNTQTENTRQKRHRSENTDDPPAGVKEREYDYKPKQELKKLKSNDDNKDEEDGEPRTAPHSADVAEEDDENEEEKEEEEEEEDDDKSTSSWLANLVFMGNHVMSNDSPSNTHKLIRDTLDCLGVKFAHKEGVYTCGFNNGRFWIRLATAPNDVCVVEADDRMLYCCTAKKIWRMINDVLSRTTRLVDITPLPHPTSDTDTDSALRAPVLRCRNHGARGKCCCPYE